MAEKVMEQRKGIKPVDIKVKYPAAAQKLETIEKLVRDNSGLEAKGIDSKSASYNAEWGAKYEGKFGNSNVVIKIASEDDSKWDTMTINGKSVKQVAEIWIKNTEGDSSKSSFSSASGDYLPGEATCYTLGDDGNLYEIVYDQYRVGKPGEADEGIHLYSRKDGVYESSFVESASANTVLSNVLANTKK